MVGLDELHHDIARSGILVDLYAKIFTELYILFVLNGSGHVFFHLTVLNGPVLDGSHII